MENENKTFHQQQKPTSKQWKLFVGKVKKNKSVINIWPKHKRESEKDVGNNYIVVAWWLNLKLFD